MFLPRLWPRTLAKQLALVNISIISATIIGFAWYSATQMTEKETEATAARLHGLAMLIGDRVRPGLNTDTVDLHSEVDIVKYYAGIEAVIISSRDGHVWSAIQREKQGSDRFVNTETPLTIVTPNTAIPLTQYDSTAMKIWQPIFVPAANTPVLHAWLQIRYSLTSLEAVATDIMKKSLTIALFAIAMSLVILRLLIHRPMLDLKRSAEFAEWLDHTQGGQLDVKCHAQEIERLAVALNRTSKTLFDHEAAQRSSATLLTAIRELQSQYISELDTRLLFTNVLNKVTHFTQSELGFIGDVLISEDDKPFIKMLAVTEMSRNEQFSEFEQNFAPKGLEFHNLQNLFGVILQTNKPTLANDPATDPRRGGFPKGHPPINNFLGLPVFYGGQLVGVVAVANRHKGYDQTIVDYIQPLMSTIGHIMQANHTENKRLAMQDEARESNIRLATILNTMADGVITFNVDGLIETINPAIVRMFGGDPDEFVGKPVSRYIPDLFSSPELNNLSEQICSPDQSAFSMTGLRQDGSIIPVELNIDEFSLSDIRMYTLTVRDITQRQQTEQFLRQSEQSLKQAQTIAHLGHWEFNPNEKQLICSPEVYKIFDLQEISTDDLFDALLDRVHPDDREAFIATLDQAMQTGKPFAIEHRVLHGDGCELYVSCQGEVQIQDYDQGLRIVAVVQDISERKQAARIRDEFISSVSHELRKPVTALRAALQPLASGETNDIPERAKSLLAIACKNTDRLLDSLNDLNDFDRLENRRLLFHLQLVDISSFLSEVAKDTQSLADEYSVKIQLVNDQRDVLVAIDTSRMRQVLENLLANALRFSRRGGVVELSFRQFSDMTRITVTDFGSGIADSIKNRVFQMFSHDDTDVKGTGLGLNIAKTIVERHGGQLSFESEEEVGTRFYIDLPTPLPQRISVA